MRNGHIIRQVKDLAKHPYAWPGGYPQYLVMSDGEPLCHICARTEFARIGRATRDGERSGWAAEGVDINWEDADCHCANCNARIASAYNED